MKKIIDLTVPISYHWRSPFESKKIKSFEFGDGAEVTKFTLATHWFTHIDAPKHWSAEGKTLDDFPLEYYIGDALMLDFSFVEPNQSITADMLELKFEKYPSCERVFLRTDWPRRVPWDNISHWDTAPYISEDGAFYLRDKQLKIIGFDFPQDYAIRELKEKTEHEVYMPVHDHVLKNNTLMIEYLTNLWEIPEGIFQCIALPLKLKEADGAQIRVVGIL